MTDHGKVFQQFDKTIEHLDHELSALRTGRVTPSLLEDICVDYYGTPTPLKQLAGINAPEPMLLTVQVWDVNALPATEKALRSSNLGLNPVVDSNIIRVPFPPLSEERRQELVKVAKQKAEAAKVSIRAIREEFMRSIKEHETSGDLSEDAAAIERKNVQKAVEEANQQILDTIEKKEGEILRV